MSQNIHHLLEDLDGYLGLGMPRESIVTATELLRHTALDGHGFGLAIFAIVDWHMPDQAREACPDVEAAYARLDPQDQAALRWRMLCFYTSIQQRTGCLAFATVTPFNAVDARNSMEAYLAASDLPKALQVGDCCQYMLADMPDEYDQAVLHHTLALYFANEGRWLRAMEQWELIKFPQPHWHDAVRGSVQACVSMALKLSHAALESMGEYRTHRQPELELSHPRLNDMRIKKLQQDLGEISPALNEIAKMNPGQTPG